MDQAVLVTGGSGFVAAHVIEQLLAPRPRPNAGWMHIGGSVVVLVLALFNSFVHARDGWTSVVPTGLTLSVITVVVMIVTAFAGHSLSYRRVERVEP